MRKTDNVEQLTAVVEQLAVLIEENPDVRDILLLGFNVDEKHCTLYTMFADMCCKPIPLAAVPAPKPLNWATLESINPFLLRVAFEDGSGFYEIPTNEIRALVDNDLVLQETVHVSEHGERVRQRLRTIREQKGLTQDQLASAAGLGRVTLNRIENGVQTAKLETLEKLAGGLGVDVATLLL